MSASSVFRMAQVVKVFPQHRTCELVFMDDGWRQSNVPILSYHVSSDSGGWAMHNMPRPPDELLAGGYQPNFQDRQVMAVCAMVEGNPIVIGFQHHILTELEFIETEQNRDIWRHPSGTIVTINKTGAMTVQHTGGMFLKIGYETDTTPEDQLELLAPLAYNENWEDHFNEPPTVTLSNGEFRLRIRPNGDTEILSGGNLDLTYNGYGNLTFNGDVTARISGSLTASAGGDVKVRTPATATVSSGQDATVQTLANAHVFAAGSVDAAAAGDASVVAAGAVQASAAGPVTVSAGAELTVASLGPMTLAAPEILALTNTFIIMGELVEMGGPGGLLAEELARPLMEAALERGTAAGEAAGPEVEAAQADAEQAVIDAEEAERIAIETSLPAIGLAPPDNEGQPL